MRDTVKTNIELPIELHRKAKVSAAFAGVALNYWMVFAMRELLKSTNAGVVPLGLDHASELIARAQRNSISSTPNTSNSGTSSEP
jgi:hypothetical protein